MNLARLNHILIPKTKAERDRFRRARFFRMFGFIAALWTGFSPEGRFLLIAWPIIGAIALNIRYSQTYVLFSALTGLLLAAMILRGRFRLDDVSLEVASAPRVTVDQQASFTVTLHNRGQRVHQALKVESPFLPWDGRYTQRDSGVPHLPPGGSASVVLSAAFTERGEHHLDPFTARALVPLGVTTSAPVQSRGVRFVVVPRIAPVSRLETPMSQRYQPGGVALASRTGESMELMGVRPYRPGDPIRDLHARTWARLGQPVVREYQQEYFSRVGVVLDTETHKIDDPVLEAGVSLAAGVVAHLSRGEALIDLLVVGDRVHRLTLGRNLGFLEQALDLLACVEPSPALKISSLEARLDPFLSRLSCVVFVALSWDSARRGFIRRVTRRGVGCRALLVSEDSAPLLHPGRAAASSRSLRSRRGPARPEGREDRRVDAPGTSLRRHPRVQAYVQQRVDAVNARLARHETIKKFCIAPAPITVEAGLLTPSLKVKRAKVYERFSAALEALYE